MNRRIILFLAAGVSFSLAGSIFAETIFLKSGEQIKGKIVESSNDYIDYIKIVPEEKSEEVIYFSSEIAKISMDGEKPSGPEDLQAPWEYCKRGWKFVLDKQYEKAKLDLEKAMKLNPNLPCAYQVMGFLNLQTGEYKEAVNNFSKASQLEPDNARAYCGIGASYNAMNQPGEAVNYLEKAIKLDSSYAEAYFQLGKAYYDLKEDAKAKANLIKARDLPQDQTRSSSMLEEINQLLSKIP